MFLGGAGLEPEFADGLVEGDAGVIGVFGGVGFVEVGEGGVEEDVSVGGVGDDEVEWGVAGSDYRYGSLGDGLCVAVPAGQHVLFSERFEVLLDRYPGLCCVGLEVQEKNKTGVGSPVEYAKRSSWLFQRAGAGFGVLMLENGDKRVDVQFLEGR